MPEHGESIRAAMADLLNGHAPDSGLHQALTAITTTAVKVVDGVDFADIMIIADEGRARSVSATAVPLLAELDDVQMTLRQGPCLSAAVGGSMIRCTDLREDERWPGYAAAAVAAGVHSMLSFQLATAPHGVGALNLFGLEPRAPDPAAEAIGALLATLATVAMMTAHRETQFEAALAGRDVIGQAKGILMNHFKVDASRAFDMLRSISQADNTPLRLVALKVVESL
ncbi:GAF and ANTAR domain-containing protein [Mycolicibacterium sp. P1-18]|uniref:GAF and ANTAR domain-containing protein n=1 Tax=Mycolicibacterium sp. P1-18 TaxID=2024615 RepID=UPI0015638B40|nr:GAF and ANTAR domain-containing protein [Mycolicibacterium sp. P1-18]